MVFVPTVISQIFSIIDYNTQLMYEFTPVQFCEQDMDEKSMGILIAIFAVIPEKQNG